MNLVALFSGLALGILLGLSTANTWRASKYERIDLVSAPPEQTAPIPTLRSRNLPPKSAMNNTQPPDRILCWMPVLNLDDHLAVVVNETFGRYCDKFYFVAKEGRIEENVISHHYERKDRHDLWNQVHRGWARIAEMHLEEYDWFVKLDDDSFFYADNFRYMVRRRQWDPESNVYFGHYLYEQSRPVDQPRAQFNLGAGYGVSRGLLRRIYPYFPTAVHSTIPQKSRCPEWFRWGEDVKFADCLRILYPSLLPNRTRDEFDRETFNAFTPTHHLLLMQPPWYERGFPKALITKQRHIGCCSPRPVLWHKAPHIAFVLDYFQFQLAVDPMPKEDMVSLAPPLTEPLVR